MAITAADIQTVSFSIDRKGYDVDEVDVFLEHVASEVENMTMQMAQMEQEIIRLQFELRGGTVDTADDAVIPEAGQEASVEAAAPAADSPDKDAEISRLQATIEDLQKQLAEKAANDSAISQALIVAQRSADEVVSNARAEASNIIKDADEEADRIVGKAEGDRQRIIESIRTLEADRSDVRAEYREMLSNFMADAQKKLAEIDGDARRANVSAQARAEANGAAYNAPVSAAPVQPVPAPAQTPVSSLPSVSGFIDKDFSGFGATDSDFEFDDID